MPDLFWNVRFPGTAHEFERQRVRLAALKAPAPMAPATRKTRIAMVVPSLDEGGGVPAAAQFVGRVAEHSFGAHVDWISLPCSRTNAASRRLLRPWGWATHPTLARRVFLQHEVLEIGGSLAEFEPLRCLSNSLRRAVLSDYDLIQVVCGTPAWANAAFDAGPPVAVHAATLARLERGHVGRRGALGRHVFQRTFMPVIDYLDRRGVERADHVFVMNPWMNDWARSVRGQERVSLAPPGIDTECYTPDGERRNGDYIIAVARWSDYRKRLDVTLRAYAELHRMVPHAPPLFLVGKSPPLPEDTELARALGVDSDVRYIGVLTESELAAAYRGARAFISTADEEGFGLSILEAMASGCGVVATRSGGPEFTIEDGVSGILVPRRDPVAAAKGLARLLSDDAHRTAMGRAARERVESTFSVAHTSAEFVRVWQGLLERDKPCAESLA